MCPAVLVIWSPCLCGLHHIAAECRVNIDINILGHCESAILYVEVYIYDRLSNAVCGSLEIKEGSICLHVYHYDSKVVSVGVIRFFLQWQER